MHRQNVKPRQKRGFGSLVYRSFQLRLDSVNCEPLSAVQFNWVGETSAQLTRDWVLRTSEVILISTSEGEDCV